MKDFSLLESVGKERIKKQQIGEWQDHKNTPSESGAIILGEKCYVVLYIKESSTCAII